MDPDIVNQNEDIHPDPIQPQTWSELIQGSGIMYSTGSAAPGSGQSGLTENAGGLTPIAQDLKSSNFNAGAAGWRIRSNGDVEFNNGTFRGTLTASSIHIPNTTTANSFHVDTDGNAWWGATTLAAAVAYVKKDGSAKFTSGTIGGWTIGSTTLTGGNITLDQGNDQISVGASSAIIIDGSTSTIKSNDGTTWTMNGNGTLVGFGSKINRSVTNVDTHSTNTEQTLMSVSIPANTLGTTNVVHFKMFISDFDHTDNVSDTIRLKYGATTLATIDITDTGAGNKSNLRGWIEGYLFAAGATNSQEGSISFSFGNSVIQNSTEDNLTVIGAASGTSAIDSTAAANLVVTAQHGSSSTTSGIVMAHYVVTKIA